MPISAHRSRWGRPYRISGTEAQCGPSHRSSPSIVWSISDIALRPSWPPVSRITIWIACGFQHSTCAFPNIPMCAMGLWNRLAFPAFLIGPPEDKTIGPVAFPLAAGPSFGCWRAVRSREILIHRLPEIEPSHRTPQSRSVRANVPGSGSRLKTPRARQKKLQE